MLTQWIKWVLTEKLLGRTQANLVHTSRPNPFKISNRADRSSMFHTSWRCRKAEKKTREKRRKRGNSRWCAKENDERFDDKKRICVRKQKSRKRSLAGQKLVWLDKVLRPTLAFPLEVIIPSFFPPWEPSHPEWHANWTVPWNADWQQLFPDVFAMSACSPVIGALFPFYQS